MEFLAPIPRGYGEPCQESISLSSPPMTIQFSSQFAFVAKPLEVSTLKDDLLASFVLPKKYVALKLAAA
eukprot:scaffold1082_cov60-Attheya_sp.AAC.2